MKIIDCKQGSDEWLNARLGIVTASELDALVTPLWKPRKIDGDGVTSYLCKKIAEKWRGAPLQSFHGGSMEQGAIREEEARAWYELDQNVTVKQVGLILSDDGKMGCSPDGLLEDGGLEIKCPEPHTHVGYLLEGVLPPEYAAQVYGSLLVTGLPRWRFLSYCRGFPPLLLTIEADATAMDAIRAAVAAFQTRLDEAWAAIENRNGGPPEKYEPAPVDPDYVFA